MNDIVKELSLLLLYLTSWEEDAVIAKVCRSWKGYPFETLDDLTEEEYISGSRRSKSVYITEKGIRKAQEIAKKYQIEDDNI
ncbi:MAG: DUF6429 family protein [Tepidanaerobacteraceae bacterium]|nr:DUF6429 family protein [Tepidanaerobacteraceae bacterium]